MASGTPVVSSNTTGIPEVAGSAAILLSPENVTDHVDAITGLLRDESARQSLARQGRLRAEGYHWSRSAELLAAHFRALL